MAFGLLALLGLLIWLVGAVVVEKRAAARQRQAIRSEEVTLRDLQLTNGRRG